MQTQIIKVSAQTPYFLEIKAFYLRVFKFVELDRLRLLKFSFRYEFPWSQFSTLENPIELTFKFVPTGFNFGEFRLSECFECNDVLLLFAISPHRPFSHFSTQWSILNTQENTSLIFIVLSFLVFITLANMHLLSSRIFLFCQKNMFKLFSSRFDWIFTLFRLSSSVNSRGGFTIACSSLLLVVLCLFKYWRRSLFNLRLGFYK